MEIKTRIANILGTNYKIVFKDDDKIFKESNSCGYIDYTAKEIYILILKESAYRQDNEVLYNATIRHELIHAFLYESGLCGASFADNEEMIDFFALQFVKMANAMNELDILEQ